MPLVQRYQFLERSRGGFPNPPRFHRLFPARKNGYYIRDESCHWEDTGIALCGIDATASLGVPAGDKEKLLC